MKRENTVVLFDGPCVLCQGAVRFIARRDPTGRFLFAALESEAGRRLLGEAGWRERAPDSVVLLEDGCVYMESTAALRIVRKLRGAWPLLYGLVVVPRLLRDVVYRWIARNRHRWFGHHDACPLPSSELRERFIS